MTKIVTLPVPRRIESLEARLGALLDIFASQRRFGDDVYWLKENAEVLNILESTGQNVVNQLGVHQQFYDSLQERFAFFPQYYRFLLSISLDLEDLGMPGKTAETLIDKAVADDLVRAELSDLQRAEARRLMLRRGRDPLPYDPGLEDRLRGFVENAPAFALPNKKAAYELTHIVFYLSEYGGKDPNLGEGALASLEYAGVLSFLDQNVDLMAEICLSMVWAGKVPPKEWVSWISYEASKFDVEETDAGSIQDDYHTYLMCNWFGAISGLEPFRNSLKTKRTRFTRSQSKVAPLRQISECMYQLGPNRSASWTEMRNRVEATLSPDAQYILSIAESSSDVFEKFFEGFSRARRQTSAVVF